VKRIIDGVTYNTDTSTVLAKSAYETLYNNEPFECEGTLYQSRGGAFFVAETVDLGHDEDGERITRNRAKALSAKDAETWIMTGDVEVFHNPFSEPPEATAEESPGATIFVRAPVSLKHRVEAAAKKEGLSVNAFMLRIMDNALAATPTRAELRKAEDEKMENWGKALVKIHQKHRKVEDPHVNLSKVAPLDMEKLIAPLLKKSQA
jgi:hypothetical protein